MAGERQLEKLRSCSKAAERAKKARSFFASKVTAMAEELSAVELEDAQMIPATTVTVEPGTTDFHTLERLYY